LKQRPAIQLAVPADDLKKSVELTKQRELVLYVKPKFCSVVSGTYDTFVQILLE
jgi:hypothetical protein